MARFSCGIQCTRWLLFILNILFFISGLTVLGFGIYVQVSRKFDVAFSDDINGRMLGGDVIEWIGIVMISAGSFTVLLSAFGCLGAAFKNRCFLYLYAIILLLLIIAQLTAMISTLTERSKIRNSYESGFRELFIEIYQNNHTDLQHVIEGIEREFQCCGVLNSSDYSTVNYPIPVTCHEGVDINRPIFTKGCAHAVIDWTWNQLPIIGGALGAVLLLEIFGVITAVALGIAISHSLDYDDKVKFYHN